MNREIEAATATNITLRGDNGVVQIMLVDASDCSSPRKITRLVRVWGESLGMRSVWFQIDGAAPATLDCTVSDSVPQEAAR